MMKTVEEMDLNSLLGLPEMELRKITDEDFNFMREQQERMRPVDKYGNKWREVSKDGWDE
jgi:hypothetical protein